jgi:hypothetical protein
VAKVEFHAGELFPRGGFIVTNLETLSRAVVRFYNKRGFKSFSSQSSEAGTFSRSNVSGRRLSLRLYT